MPKITFLNYSNGIDQLKDSPVPMIKSLPEWYKKFPKYLDEATEEHPTHSTVKNCMPFFDAMSSGYSLVTPCDIEFYVENNIPKARIYDERYGNFIGTRYPIQHFAHPIECYEIHFHWEPNWAISLEKGYSALYLSPLNRYDLPFVTTSGIVDNDEVNVRGLIPFFLKKGIDQVFVPKGTPFVQIIPFKREEWSSSSIILTEKDIDMHTDYAFKKYRDVKHSGYKNIDWHRKIFE